MRHYRTLAMLGSMCCACFVAAQDGADKMPPDHQFVLKISAWDMAEMNLGNLAAEKSASPAVKEFGRKMIEHHSKANKDLAELANKKSMKLAMGMSEEHTKLRAKLAELNGPVFDRAFLAAQIKDHQDVVALFEKQIKDGLDDDLKKWATENLPREREHLKVAEDLHKKMETDNR